MYRYSTILFTLFLSLLVTSCLEDSLESSHTAEMYYVDLLYALHHHDQAGAKEAARQFSKNLPDFHAGNYPIRPEGETEELYFNLSKAERSYLQARASIDRNELEQAMIQLDRASFELEAARVPGYEELYIARIHDFLSAWLEVSRTTDKEEISDREWRAINRRVKGAYTSWRQCQWILPSPTVYFFSEEDTADFAAAHGQVDRLMEELKASLPEEDPLLTKSYVDATDSAVWALVRRFGSPEEGGLDITPPEI